MVILHWNLCILSRSLIVLIVVIILSYRHVRVLPRGLLDWLKGVLRLYSVLHAFVEVVSIDSVIVSVLVDAVYPQGLVVKRSVYPIIV